MTTLTIFGWVAAHAVWQCTFIAGLTALALGLLRHARPEARDRVARLSLAAMAVLPIVTALLNADLLPPAARRPVVMAVDRAVPMPTYLAWRSMALPIVGGLWMAGVVFCLIRLAVAWRRAGALRSGGTGDADPAVRADVDVRRSARAQVPMVLGWRRPVILLPDRAIATLAPGQLRAILAHELAHVRRGDYLANALQLVADSLTFFHPAARWVSRRVRIEREYCCDDAAILVAGGAVYARALAALDDARSDCRLAVAAVSGTLLDRIERIAGRSRRALTPARGAIVLLAAVVAAAALVAAMLALPPNIPAGVKLRSSRPPGGTSPRNAP